MACKPAHEESHGEAHHEPNLIVATSPLEQDVVITQKYVCQKPTQKKPPPPVAEISR